MSELAERIRSEAAIADRPGQMSRLEEIAREVDRLQDENAALIDSALSGNTPNPSAPLLHLDDEDGCQAYHNDQPKPAPGTRGHYIDKIPDDLWAKAQAKAAADGESMRAVVLRKLEEYVK